MPLRTPPPFRTSGLVVTGGGLTLPYQCRSSLPQRITQVTNEMPGAGSALCSVRFNDGLISPLAAARDAAVGEPFVWLDPGDLLTVVWSGAPVGLLGTMLVFYDYGDA